MFARGREQTYNRSRMRRVTPITRKVNLIIILSLVIGVGAVITFLSDRGIRDLSRSTRQGLEQQAALLYQAIKNAMLPGEAPIAVSLLKDISTANPAYDIQLFRATGVEAFSDNTTIAVVNRNLGRDSFKDKTSLPASPAGIPPGDAMFGLSVAEARRNTSEAITTERWTVTIYDPLLNLPECAECHGSDHTVRGVIRIRADLSPLLVEQRDKILVSAAMFVGLVVALAAILTAYMHGSIINPVKQIGDVCSLVTGGKFDVRVAIRSKDEIGVLGDTINEMIQGLYERFELSRFVSSSTLQSIKNREKGAMAELTMLFSDVRGFTAFSERRAPEEVVESLNRILNVQTEIIHKCGGDVDKYVGDEVVALFSGPEQAFQACHAATEIQREVRREGGSAYGGLAVGVGIDTGEVVLGAIGSEKRADFTVIGDHVNFAARLCGAAQAGQVIVSEATRRAAGGRVRARGPYSIRVKGKQDPQRVYVLDSEGTRA